MLDGSKSKGRIMRYVHFTDQLLDRILFPNFNHYLIDISDQKHDTIYDPRVTLDITAGFAVASLGALPKNQIQSPDFCKLQWVLQIYYVLT